MSDKAFTAEELSQYNGTNGQSIYISVKGIVYDVSSGADFYGPEGGYHIFAAKEVSRQLGKTEIGDNEVNASWKNLNEEHLKTLDEWEVKYQQKYPVVGKFAPDAGFEERGSKLTP